MDIADIARRRHTCKAYDPDRRLSAEQLAQIRQLLRCSPSSVNSQPWHFFIAASDEAKARIATATRHPVYAANTPKILQASHVVVLCARQAMTDEMIERITEQEFRDGRFPAPEGRANQLKSRRFYVNLHRTDLRDVQPWMEKQVYLALGTLLLGAAAMGIDATPIEGFDARALNAELGLAEQGLSAVVLAALGYRSDADFNAALPKSRLPVEDVITEL